MKKFPDGRSLSDWPVSLAIAGAGREGDKTKLYIALSLSFSYFYGNDLVLVGAGSVVH